MEEGGRRIKRVRMAREAGDEQYEPRNGTARGEEK